MEGTTFGQRIDWSQLSASPSIPRIMNEKSSSRKTKWPVKAYANRTFLNCSEARSIRVQCELTEPKHRLQENAVHNTIVFFGSARIQSEAVARAHLEELERKGRAAETPEEEWKRELGMARSRVEMSAYYEYARALARRLTEWSMKIENPKHRFVVCSGGGPGIMEAANRGAEEAGGKSIGFGISLPFEQQNNPYVTRELNFEFHYFFVRKYWFLYHAESLVVFPGGYGTMDELFEMLTLLQTNKIEKYMPIVLIGSGFWNEVVNFERLCAHGVISENDLKMFRILDSVEEAEEFIVSELSKIYLK